MDEAKIGIDSQLKVPLEFHNVVRSRDGGTSFYSSDWFYVCNSRSKYLEKAVRSQEKRE
jgi:hypothetical protein